MNSQMSNESDEQCSSINEVHPVDPFHSQDNLKIQSATVHLCMSLDVYIGRNGAVIEYSVVVSL